MQAIGEGLGLDVRVDVEVMDEDRLNVLVRLLPLVGLSISIVRRDCLTIPTRYVEGELIR